MVKRQTKTTLIRTRTNLYYDVEEMKAMLACQSGLTKGTVFFEFYPAGGIKGCNIVQEDINEVTD